MRAREQLEQLQVAREWQAEAAVLRGRREPQVAALAQLVPERLRYVALALDQLGPALALLAHVGLYLLLELGEARLGELAIRRGDHHLAAPSLDRSRASARACSRNRYFWTLPEAVRGSAATSSRCSGQ